MAKNKTNSILFDEGLAFSREQEDPLKHVDDLTALFSPTTEHRPLGTTQGRKGQKAKRINMAFSDDNHAYLTYESRRRGLSITQFVNLIIDLYKASPDGKVD